MMKTKNTLRCAWCSRAVAVPADAIAEPLIKASFWFGDIYITCTAIRMDTDPNELLLVATDPAPEADNGSLSKSDSPGFSESLGLNTDTP
jgi:hypothetical protein